MSSFQPIQNRNMEMAHVLMMDLVGYSKIPIDEQTAVVEELKHIVSETSEYQNALHSQSLIVSDSGDGMALVFFGGPEMPARCALEIAKALRETARLELRMGINTGPVYRTTDIKGVNKVAGDAINLAQRVMDAGDSGHILLSSSNADILKRSRTWATDIHELGIAEVKHGVDLHFYNLVRNGLGNPDVPTKLRGRFHSKEVHRPATLVWDQLLQLIDEGQVVPVVGRDLLVVNAGNTEVLYYRLAVRLAQYFSLPSNDLPEGEELNEVVYRHLNSGGLLDEIYPALKVVAAEIEKLPIPEPIRQLAAIRPFKLFVTTTFDPLLSRALDQVRFAGQPTTRVLAYAPNQVQDIPKDFKNDPTPVVYHLLGKLSATPSYAVTQEDVMEFFHYLQSDTRKPPLLFDELSRQSLLVLGSRFGDWLTRFFMRMSKGQRLSTAGRLDYLAEDEVAADNNLVLFLRHFSRGTKIYTGHGVIEFVGELHKRWTERHPTPSTEPITNSQASADQLQIRPGAIFLSHAREDWPAAEKIRNALEAAGMDVFLENEGTWPNDNLSSEGLLEGRVRRNIRECSLFMPIISRHTMASEHTFFRNNWNLALEEVRAVPFSDQESFLLPIVVDDIRADVESVLPKFKGRCDSLPAGQPSAEFISRVQGLYRKFQRARMTIS